MGNWISRVRRQHLELKEKPNLGQKGHYEKCKVLKMKPESQKRSVSGKKEVGGNKNTRISSMRQNHSETLQEV